MTTRRYQPDEEKMNGKVKVTSPPSGFGKRQRLTRDLIQDLSDDESRDALKADLHPKVFIEALVDCDLYVFNRTSLDIIKKEIPEWASFEQIYRAQISMCLLNFQRKIIHSSSIDSFTLFSKSYNQAFNSAPKKHIASFLGVSPFTLSRIKI